jgi:hypothetical protein
MRDTRYATELNTAEDPNGQRIERLYVKELGREEIRFSCWKDGQLMIRPLDLPEDELLPLLSTAFEKGVFKEEFLIGLQSALASHLSRSRYEKSLASLRDHGRRSPGEDDKATAGLIAYLRTVEPIDEDWPEIEDSPPEPVNL